MQKTLLKRCVKARGMRAFVRCLGAICKKFLEVGSETWELNRLPTSPIKRKWRGISLIMTSFLRHHDSSATGGERAARPEPLFARPIHLSYDQVPDREERETATSAVRAGKNAGISLSLIRSPPAAGKLAALKRERRPHSVHRINRRINVGKK